MSATEFKFGDRVVHSGRPEWGTGVVTAVQPVIHEGKTPEPQAVEMVMATAPSAAKDALRRVYADR